MFLYENNNQGSSKKEPMSDQQFYASLFFIFMGLLALWVYKNEDYLMGLLFDYFNWLAFTAFAILMMFTYMALRKFNEVTKKFTDRGNLLSKVGNHKAGVYVGKTTDGAKIFLPEKVRTGHVQILGATGRGKTESVILPWFIRDLQRGYSAVLIDGKGDRELYDRIEHHTKKLDQKARLIVFDLGSPELSAVTNPLKTGSSQQDRKSVV